jgi:molybdopterin synthase catalytic subunit
MLELRQEVFDPYAEIVRHQSAASGNAGKVGAICSFVGTMRDYNGDETVSSMTLEHYPGMTEKMLHRVMDEARRQWSFRDALLIHRVGQVLPEQPIVLVAVWSARRGAAFDACRYIVEELKHRAPFWKKEMFGHGGRWVEHNSDGYREA